MAGIGFALRKLSRRDDLAGTAQALVHSSLASSGPWLMTILALGSIGLASSTFMEHAELSVFRLILIYNFAFSLVLSGPMVSLITRCLADQIYEKDVTQAPTMLLGSIAVVCLGQLPLAFWFYFHYVELPPLARLASFVNLFLVNGIWLVSVFLSALKDFRSVSNTFGAGMLVGTVSALLLGRSIGMNGLLLGFDVGLACILFTLLARVFAEYPYPIAHFFPFRRFAIRYWEIVAGGLLYNLAIWIDKGVMAFSLEAQTLPSRMFSYPDYDAAMFAAYLSIVPSLAIFVYRIETSFFEKYLRFYSDIREHRNLAQLRKSHQDLMSDLLHNARTFVVLQIGISATIVLLAPKLFDALNMSYAQLGIFRLGLVGSLFHALFMFISIVLSYFDLRRVNLVLQGLFLLSNLVFTLITKEWGFPYYGYGYFASSLLSFLVAFAVAVHYIQQLPYMTFIRGNPVVSENRIEPAEVTPPADDRA